MKTTDCPHLPDTSAFLAGELPPLEQARFADHLPTCPVCEAEAAALESTRRILLTVPAAIPSPDLTQRILAAIEKEKSTTAANPFRRDRWPTVAALAACAALAFVVIFQPASPRQESHPVASTAATPEDTHREMAMHWLIDHQEPNGSWDAARWGGSPKFQIALTALSALALFESLPAGDERLFSASRACAWLSAQQNPDGTFGPPFQGTPYNHAMATMAVLHAHRLNPDEEKKSTLDRALAAMTRRQFADGAWGYNSLPFRGDHSITEWNLAALDQATRDGWSGFEDRANRARQWMKTRPRSAQAEPPDSPSESLARASAHFNGPDLYAAYFQVQALLRDTSPASRDRLAEVRQLLRANQEQSGDHAGSWPPEDRWSLAGGRLYSTAMATLALANR